MIRMGEFMLVTIVLRIPRKSYRSIAIVRVFRATENQYPLNRAATLLDVPSRGSRVRITAAKDFCCDDLPYQRGESITRVFDPSGLRRCPADIRILEYWFPDTLSFGHFFRFRRRHPVASSTLLQRRAGCLVI